MIEQKAAQFSTPYQFNGKELDSETGLYNYGARYYDPSLSLWLGVDPLAERGPQYSPYNYCFNNPIRLKDPDGRWPIETIWDIGNVLYDIGKIGTGYVIGNPAMVTSGSIDLGLDVGAMLIPYVPAGLNKLRHADDVVKVVDGYADDVVKQASQKGTDAHKAAKSDMARESGEGVIYKVDGKNTPSGKPYVGSADDLSKRAKTATDGRNRTSNTEVIGGYTKGNRNSRRAAEQQGINNNGGVKNLDNKRNEIKSSDWNKHGINGGG